MKLTKLPALPETAPPWWPRLSTRLRSEALTARLGRLVGIAFTVCFVTGYLSHLQYHPLSWLPTPAMPVWGYRLTQGVHVCTGIATMPLLLAKLWSVYPRLFSWPVVGSILVSLERLSILILVSTASLELFTGFLNILDWYPWPWDFVLVHYLLAFVVIGSIMLHIAVKLPVIKRGLATDLRRSGILPSDQISGEALPATAPPAMPETGSDGASPIDAPAEAGVAGMTRRGALVTAGVGVGLVTLTTAGQTVRPLEPIALLAPRRPKSGPLGVPINRTAEQTGVTKAAQSASYQLHVLGPTPFSLALSEVNALPTVERSYPISCVEGWSAGATWRGIELYDLVRRGGGDADSAVVVRSLQKGGPQGSSRLVGAQMRAALLATHLNGVRLPLDHGYPLRLIAPNRAGALQTKWITIVEIG